VSEAMTNSTLRILSPVGFVKRTLPQFAPTGVMPLTRSERWRLAGWLGGISPLTVTSTKVPVNHSPR